MRFLLMALICLLMLDNIQSQESAGQQKIIEDGKTYLLYKVQPGETFYAISKKFKIDIQELRNCNPRLQTDLKSGETLRIPVLEELSQKNAANPSGSQKSYIEHKVQKKETLYFISRKYGIPVSDIIAFNPGLTQLKKGEVILIPTGSKQEPSVSQVTASSTISHTILPGETLYSVSRKYNVSSDRIVTLNPSLKNGFISGTVIQIPMSETSAEKAGPGGNDAIRHIVTKGETLFGISQNYHVPMAEIIKSNSFLENRSMRTGDTLLIVPDKNLAEAGIRKSGLEMGNPVRLDDNAQRITGGCNPDNRFKKEGKSIQVKLLLPLMIEQNRYLNSDLLSQGITTDSRPLSDTAATIHTKEKHLEFQGNSENFFHFYEGVLIALDSLQQAGIQVRLDVLDTEQKTSRIKYLINSGSLDGADLIIGPVYPNELKEISDFVNRKRIPLISPLSASDDLTKNNPWFFQVNPNKEYLSQKTLEYVARQYENSNIIVVQTSISDNSAVEEMEKLKLEAAKAGDKYGNTEIRLCNFRKDGYVALKDMLQQGRKNIILIPSSSEAEVNVVVTSIKPLVRDYEILLIGTNRFPQYESINPEFYHLGNLEFLAPYWPDFKDHTTKNFVYKFRNYFKTEPNQFSMQGYDVTFFFIRALYAYGTELRDCIPYAMADLVQGTYHFEPFSSGGYINRGLSIIKYTSDFEVIRKMVLFK